MILIFVSTIAKEINVGSLHLQKGKGDKFSDSKGTIHRNTLPERNSCDGFQNQTNQVVANYATSNDLETKRI